MTVQKIDEQFNYLNSLTCKVWIQIWLGAPGTLSLLKNPKGNGRVSAADFRVLDQTVLFYLLPCTSYNG
jgi:hypothetical protein